MAMNASSLANEMKSAVVAIDFTNGEISNDQVMLALATAIINHIKNNAKAVDAGGTGGGQWPII